MTRLLMFLAILLAAANVSADEHDHPVDCNDPSVASEELCPAEEESISALEGLGLFSKGIIYIVGAPIYAVTVIPAAILVGLSNGLVEGFIGDDRK